MVLMSFRRIMKLSSAMDSVVGDNGRGEGGTSVDIYASLCNSGMIQTMVRSRAKKVNRSRSPRLNEAHPSPCRNTTTDYVSLSVLKVVLLYYMIRNSTYMYNSFTTSGGISRAPAQWRGTGIMRTSKQSENLKTKDPVKLQ